MERVSFQCWAVTSGVACPARFTGTTSSVVDAASSHAIGTHGYADNRRLRERIRALVEVEEDTAGDPIDPTVRAQTGSSDKTNDGT